MFESKTYENLMAEMMAYAPTGFDTREGSVFFDAVSAAALIISRQYTVIDNCFDLFFISTATDEYLDERASEYGLSRSSAVSASYYFLYEGTLPELGSRFFANSLYFVLTRNDKGELCLVAEIAGVGGNVIAPGTAAMPVKGIESLISATFGEFMEPGVDEESDDSLRERVQQKMSGGPENGNRAHYKYWCEEDAGVGSARIRPLWLGENTVKAVLLDADGKPAADAVVDRVQNYIDPATLGMTVEVDGVSYVYGDGLGDGKANIGAHFTAAPALQLPIDISCKVTLGSGGTIEQVISDATTAIEEYLSDLALQAADDETTILRYNEVGTIIFGLSSVLDYMDLEINGASVNIEITPDEAAVLVSLSIEEAT